MAELLAVLAAVLLAAWGTPVAAEMARRYGVMDHPTTGLKAQKEPVPYFGGLAVYLAFLIPFSLVSSFDQRELAVLLSGTIMLLVGLVDDFGAMSPATKFAGQLIATVVLVRAGVQIQLAILPDWMDLVLTFLWIVGITNAFNLVDILDGLASTLVLSTLVPFALIAWTTGQRGLTIMAACLAGAVAGYLPRNWKPARIYLGDTGSLFLGFMAAALTMLGDYSQKNAAGALVPVLLLAFPIFETGYVVILRLIQKRNPFHGSPDHFPLRLRRKGFSVPAVVAFCACLNLLGAGVAMWVPGATTRPALLAIGVLALLFMLAGVWLARIPMPMPDTATREVADAHA